MRKNSNYYIRKAHRYLGILIGVQFLFWTISGLYFSWTDIDEIHGDHFLKEAPIHSITDLNGLDQIDSTLKINSLELRFIVDQPYYWINNQYLYDIKTGNLKSEITKREALAVANEHLTIDYTIDTVEYLTEVGNHHEYRERPLPVWAISFQNHANLTAYVSALDGSFQRIRHRSWRWFDFLWMTHTMDYQNRDDFNNWLLRAFSVFGLITVLSGFLLFFVSSPSVRKIRSRLRKKSKT